MCINKLFIVLFSTLCLAWSSSGANILFFWGVSTYSHRIIVWPLVTKLVDKGHNVTFLSSFPSKVPNSKVHEIVLTSQTQDFLRNNLDTNTTIIDHRLKSTHGIVWEGLPASGISYCEVVTQTAEIVNWIKSSQYDLVVIDALFNDCALGLAYKFKAPHIVFGTTSIFMWHYDAGGFPAETSWIPNLRSEYPQKMKFFERVFNTLDPIYWSFYRQWVYFPKLETMLRTALDMPDMPPLKELEQETSLVLLNTHYSLDYARSLPPNVISVGGMQCDNSTNPLPKMIREFIEAGGEEGFIYVSFGSTAQFSKAPEYIKQIIFQAFLNSPIRFILKWESEVPAEMPSNVLTGEWMPQKDILAHPKIRAFITHAGLLSIQEATFNGVPLIAFPLFAEQDYNAERIAQEGIGIRLDIRELTLPKFLSAINSILTNPRYKMKMKETSSMFKNRPMNPLDTAVWWTEYVLQNKEASSYLKPLAIHQTWYERRSLDVWLFIFLIVFVLASVMTIFIVNLLRIVIGKFYVKDNVKEKKM